THRDVVVLDEGFERAVGRLLGFGAVDVESRAHRTVQAAAHAASAAGATALRRGRAHIRVERALPHRRAVDARTAPASSAAAGAGRAAGTDHELDRLVV